MNKISQTEIVDGAQDFRFMTRQMVDSILSMKEYNRFSKGIFSWVGFDTKWIDFEDVERAAGETKWSFWGLFKYAIEGITAFSTVPLKLAWKRFPWICFNNCNFTFPGRLYYTMLRDTGRICGKNIY